MKGRTGFCSRTFTAEGMASSQRTLCAMGRLKNSALLLSKDVRPTMSSLKPVNPFTSAMLPKNKFALYILYFSHYITTLVHAIRLAIVNVGMLNGKHADIYNSYLLGDR